MKRIMFGFGAMVSVAACNTAPGADGMAPAADGIAPVAAGVAQTKQAVVRASENGGRAQVVLLQGESWTGRIVTFCSGVEIAPRVVATAAHCLRDYVKVITVYYGDDYSADAQLRWNMPAPGEPSVWALAQSFNTHPDWDPIRHHPDLAVVYLDRELPFEPMAVAAWHLGQSWLQELGELVGWGASRALSADINEYEGERVKRTGYSPILGSPTDADYHPDDPHGGILEPRVQAELLKTDGHAPWSNACTGDSGAPLIVNHGCKDYVVGVSSWTGLWCEDYGLYTRTAPFEDFFRHSLRRAGRSPVEPVVNCVADAADGSLWAYLGYDNENGIAIDIPLGRHNVLTEDVRNERPTKFLPGRHDFQVAISVPPGKSADYLLDPPEARRTRVKIDASSPRCSPNDDSHVCAQSCSVAGVACAGSTPTFTWCVQDCLGWIEVYGEYGCDAAYRDFARCMTALAPDAAWLCDPDWGSFPEVACWDPLYECLANSP